MSNGGGKYLLLDTLSILLKVLGHSIDSSDSRVLVEFMPCQGGKQLVNSFDWKALLNVKQANQCAYARAILYWCTNISRKFTLVNLATTGAALYTNPVLWN